MTFDIEFGPLKIKNYCQTSVRLILHVVRAGLLHDRFFRKLLKHRRYKWNKMVRWIFIYMMIYKFIKKKLRSKLILKEYNTFELYL